MKKYNKIIAGLVSLIMTMSAFAGLTAIAASYPDTEGHWAEEAIDYWSDQGVLSGYDDGNFKPDDTISRAEVVKVLTALVGLTDQADAGTFADVDGSEWYAASLLAGAKAGIITGDEDSNANPNDPTTREQGAALFSRCFSVGTSSSQASQYSDSDEISGWATGYVGGMTAAGYMTGADGEFRPLDYMTRAEFVSMLDQAIGAYITEAGTYTGDDVTGGIIIVAADDVVLDGITADYIVVSGDVDGTEVYNSSVKNGVKNLSPNEITTDDSVTVDNDKTLGSGDNDADATEEPDATDAADETATPTATTKTSSSSGGSSGGSSSTTTYKVTLDANGGVFSDGDETLSMNVTKNKTVAAKSTYEEPIRAGYTFTGWALEDGTEYDITEAVTEKLTIYAQWEENDSDAVTSPETVTAEQDGDSVTVTWTPVDGATAYYIAVYDSNGDIVKIVSTDDVEVTENEDGSLTYTIDGLDDGETYTVGVASSDGLATSDFTTSDGTVTTASPEASEEATSSPDASGDDDTTPTPTATADASGDDDTTPTPTATADASGDDDTTPTPTATADAGDDDTTPTPTATAEVTISAPATVTAAQNADTVTSLDVTWDAVDGATGYYVAVYDSSNKLVGVFATTEGTTEADLAVQTGTSYTVTGLTIGETYTVKVAATDGTNTSEYTASDAVTLEALESTAGFTTVPSDVDFWGKTTAELVDTTATEDSAYALTTVDTAVTAAGISNWVDGYTGFNEGDVTEQSGNYYAYQITGLNENAVIYLESKNGDVTKDNVSYKTITSSSFDNDEKTILYVAFRLTDETTTVNVIVDLDGDGTTYAETLYTIDFSNVTRTKATKTVSWTDVTGGTITAAYGESSTAITNGETLVTAGESVTITVTPTSSYAVSSVTVDGVDVTSELVAGDSYKTYTFTMPTTDVTVAATYTKTITGTLTATAANVAATPSSDLTANVTGNTIEVTGKAVYDTTESSEGYNVKTSLTYTEENATIGYSVQTSAPADDTAAAELTYTEATSGAAFDTTGATTYYVVIKSTVSEVTSYYTVTVDLSALTHYEYTVSGTADAGVESITFTKTDDDTVTKKVETFANETYAFSTTLEYGTYKVTVTPKSGYEANTADDLSITTDTSGLSYTTYAVYTVSGTADAGVKTVILYQGDSLEDATAKYEATPAADTYAVTFTVPAGTYSVAYTYASDAYDAADDAATTVTVESSDVTDQKFTSQALYTVTAAISGYTPSGEDNDVLATYIQFDQNTGEGDANPLASGSYAAAGTTLKVVIGEPTDYNFVSIAVTTAAGDITTENLETTAAGSTYSLTVPSADVTVTVTFAAADADVEIALNTATDVVKNVSEDVQTVALTATVTEPEDEDEEVSGESVSLASLETKTVDYTITSTKNITCAVETTPSLEEVEGEDANARNVSIPAGWYGTITVEATATANADASDSVTIRVDPDLVETDETAKTTTVYVSGDWNSYVGSSQAQVTTLDGVAPTAATANTAMQELLLNTNGNYKAEATLQFDLSSISNVSKIYSAKLYVPIGYGYQSGTRANQDFEANSISSTNAALVSQSGNNGVGTYGEFDVTSLLSAMQGQESYDVVVKHTKGWTASILSREAMTENNRGAYIVFTDGVEITITYKDSDGNVVEGLDVTLNGETKTTDDNGQVTFLVAENGEYTATTQTTSNYAASTKTITVAEFADSTDNDVTLEANSQTLTSIKVDTSALNTNVLTTTSDSGKVIGKVTATELDADETEMSEKEGVNWSVTKDGTVSNAITIDEDGTVTVASSAEAGDYTLKATAKTTNNVEGTGTLTIYDSGTETYVYASDDFEGNSSVFTLSDGANIAEFANNETNVVHIGASGGTATLSLDDAVTVEDDDTLTIEWEAYNGWESGTKSTTWTLTNSKEETLLSYTYTLGGDNFGVSAVTLAGVTQEVTVFNFQNNGSGQNGWSSFSANSQGTVKLVLNGDGSATVTFTKAGSTVGEYTVDASSTQLSSNNFKSAVMTSTAQYEDRAGGFDNFKTTVTRTAAKEETD